VRLDPVKKLYLPAEKILITGDLLDDMPYTGDGSPSRLIATLHDLDKLDFANVIPGHAGLGEDSGQLTSCNGAKNWRGWSKRALWHLLEGTAYRRYPALLVPG
jgi:glyoxylase-like metal-dependent hydrolase (beta-lactamase superfamily II)